MLSKGSTHARWLLRARPLKSASNAAIGIRTLDRKKSFILFIFNKHFLRKIHPRNIFIVFNNIIII